MADTSYDEFAARLTDPAAGPSTGRPRVGVPRGESPTVRGRISDEDFAAFKLLEERTGKKQSELVREAVHLLFVEHKIGA